MEPLGCLPEEFYSFLIEVAVHPLRNFQHRCFISLLCWTPVLTSSSIRATCTAAVEAVASHPGLFLKS
ncbi:hypothetical protein CsSME_00053202 [Camellia sinensis var. sinensis]